MRQPVTEGAHRFGVGVKKRANSAKEKNNYLYKLEGNT